MTTRKEWTAKNYGYEKYSIIDENGTEIGFAHRKEDAELMAAAPDVLKMLKFAQFWINLDGRLDMQGAAAAIAKAEGRAVTTNGSTNA